MKCYVLSRDLMFSSQASNAAKAAGCETQTVGSLEQISSDEPSIVVLDLTTPGFDISVAVTHIKSNAAVKTIAVGPHVQEAKLDAAREAGVDVLMTKGQASRELSNVIAKLIAEAH